MEQERLYETENIKFFQHQQDYEEFIRLTGDVEDYMIIDDVLFKMNYYDIDGKLLSYQGFYERPNGSCVELSLDIKTKNRYKYGFEDAEVELGFY